MAPPLWLLLLRCGLLLPRALPTGRTSVHRRCASPVSCEPLDAGDGGLDDVGSDGGLSEDWREFRAKLVATERAALADGAAGVGSGSGASRGVGGDSSALGCNSSWATGLYELPRPEEGSLLVASPDGAFLASPLMHRSLCLLIQHDAKLGSVALALNRPTDATLAEVVEVKLPGTLGEVPLYVGGDAAVGAREEERSRRGRHRGGSRGEGRASDGAGSPSAASAGLGSVGDFGPDGEEEADASLWLLSAVVPATTAASRGRALGSGLFLFSLEEAAELVATGRVAAASAGRSFRAFAGHLAWPKRKLEREHAAGAWAVLAPSQSAMVALLRRRDARHPTDENGQQPKLSAHAEPESGSAAAPRIDSYVEAVRAVKPEWEPKLGAAGAAAGEEAEAGSEDGRLRQALSGALQLWGETAQWEAEIRGGEQAEMEAKVAKLAARIEAAAAGKGAQAGTEPASGAAGASATRDWPGAAARTAPSGNDGAEEDDDETEGADDARR